MTAVLVMGTGKCGSSAVAGALRRLGVWMGDEFVEGRYYPVYEDAEMAGAVERIIRARVEDVALAGNPFEGLVEARRERPVWGFKYPRLIWAIPWLLDLLDDVRIIVVSRNRADTIASCSRSYGLSEERANAWYDCVSGAIGEFVSDWCGPALQVQYETLLKDRRGEVGRLAEFVFGGEVELERIEAAVESIARQSRKSANQQMHKKGSREQGAGSRE